MSRDLIDLGTDPGRYIVYPGGNTFYIDTVIEDRLEDMGVKSDQQELEEVFWRFVDPEIKRVLEPFRRREMLLRAGQRAREPAEKFETPIHIFDKRRIHFLKFGRMDQRNIELLPAKLFRVLYRKSRDEIEQTFMNMETVLAPREYKAYTYAIFNLQQFFHESFAKNTPQMLDQDKVDEHFMQQICRLNTDPLFWAGMKTQARLHDYLVRYVLMYFDYDYAPRSFIEDYIRNFINSRREYRPPHRTGSITKDEACTILGHSREALKKMSRQDLARLYRRKAQRLHPDKGGDHEKFVKLTEAYHQLLQTKK